MLPISGLVDPEYFHHFIPPMIDHLHGDLPALWLLERVRDGAVQCGPGFFVDFGFQRGLEGFVRIAGPQEVGMTDEDAFVVVVGVDEPAGNAIGAINSSSAPTVITRCGEMLSTVNGPAARTFFLSLNGCFYRVGRRY